MAAFWSFIFDECPSKNDSFIAAATVNCKNSFFFLKTCSILQINVYVFQGTVWWWYTKLRLKSEILVDVANVALPIVIENLFSLVLGYWTQNFS